MGVLNDRFGEVVKRKRVRDRLTQSDLGATIGVSGSYISSIEGSSSSARITEIEGLAATFRTTAFELIVEAAGQDSYKVNAATREQGAVVSLFESLNPEQQQMARAFMVFLRDYRA